MSVNVDRVLELASVIEKQPHTSEEDDHGFSMGAYFHTCGTPSCMAGWAIHLFDPRAEESRTQSPLWEFETAAHILGLDLQAADDLFVPNYRDLLKITPSQAASTLRHFAKTGEVNWEVGQ